FVKGMSFLLRCAGQSKSSVGRVGDKQVVHAGDAVAPDQLESVEGVVGSTQRRGVARDQMLPALALLGHEPRPLHDGDVFLHGRDAHARLIGYSRASADTDSCSCMGRRRMSRRVASARAWNSKLTSA